MAGLKELRTRLDTIRSTQQLTSAMKMVSVSKLRKAQTKTARVREMCFRLLEVYRNISREKELSGSNRLIHNGYDKTERVLIIVVASDKGLCGNFNTNVCKAAEAHIAEHYPDLSPENVSILTIGSRAEAYFKGKSYPKFIGECGLSPGDAAYEPASRMMRQIVGKFETGIFHRVDMVYCRPVNAVTRMIRVRTILPVDEILEVGDTVIEEEYRQAGSVAAAEHAKAARQHASFYRQVEILPDLQSVLDTMLPMIAVLYFYFAICQSATAEHGARMMAMSKASDNAETLIKELNLKYNKLRQTAITDELLEIISGANALGGSR